MQGYEGSQVMAVHGAFCERTHHLWTQQGGRLQSLQSGLPLDQASLQSLSFIYDEVGNVQSITDTNAGGTQTQTFAYDALDRLSSAVASGGTGGTYSLQNYTYNIDTGNLASNAGVTYTYDDNNHKHAVTGTSSGNIYSYDNNGNQTSRRVDGKTYTLIYDAENRLVQIKRGNNIQATYTYDGDGNRVKTAVGNTTTTYVGNYLEWECINTNCALRSYYYAAGQRVALRQGSSTLYFLLADHLGSTAVTATSGGGLYGELRYYPWGGTRYDSGTTPTSYRYTGQREAEVGLYYYGARYYDPLLGRFSQADNISPRIESKAQDAEQIRIALTVSYFHTTHLYQLNEHHRDALFESSLESEDDNPQKSNTLLESLLNHTETNSQDFKVQTMNIAQNFGYLGGVEYKNEIVVNANRGNISQHVTPATFGTNFTVPDRYSYTKNCPIKYTDPTGQTECDASQAIAGLGIVGLGAVPSGLGLGLAISGIIELSATSITIVGAFIGFHSLAVGTIMIGSGYAIMRAGVMAIIDSGCIPGLETDSTSP